MTPVRLTQSGTYDAVWEASVDADGTWTAEGGTYVSRERQARRLSGAERARLRHLVAALPPAAAAAPADAAFRSELVVGERVWRWAGPASPPALAALARWLAAPSG